MLYTTTRGKHDVVTAFKAAHSDCYTDGGLFVPFRMPQLDKERKSALAITPFLQIVADVLNDFFSCGLTKTDVESVLGRKPIHSAGIGRYLHTVELWHNVGADANYVVRRLSERIRDDNKRALPSNWMHIAVRIALLTASYGYMLSKGNIHPQQLLDVAVTSGDFAMPMAAWYARKMGLPIGNIICGCNANGAVWDLINRGEFPSGDIVTRTHTPDVDIVVPRNLERLIFATLGFEETKRYLQCCAKGRTYAISEEALGQLQNGLFAAVISDSRVESIIPGIYQTSGHVLSPYAALAYGSLQDYWSTTGYTRTALLIEERSPKVDGKFISALLHLDENESRGIIGL